MKNKILATTTMLVATLVAGNAGAYIFPTDGSTITGAVTEMHIVQAGRVVTFESLNASGINEPTYSGAVIENLGTSTINGSSAFENNSAPNGGAIYNTGTMTAGGTYTANQATSWGGAIYNAGNLTISDNTTFSNNKSGSIGGAITNALGTSVLTLGSNIVFTGNEAVNDGGAIGNYKGATLVSGTKFVGNKAQTGASDSNAIGGGAMSLGAESITSIANAVFEANTSGFNGGALGTRHALSANNTAAKLDVSGSTFTGNKATGTTTSTFSYGSATGGFGGALDNHFYNSNTKSGYAYVGNSTFTENEAKFGGAISNNGLEDKAGSVGKLYVENSIFTNNTASTNGGAIYNAGTLVLTGTITFSGNKANGVLNDIYNTGTMTFKDSITLDGGVAGTGTINIDSGTLLTVKAGTTTIENNVTNNGAKLALTFANGFSGDEYTLVDAAKLDNEFTVQNDNALYTIAAKEGVKGTYTVAKKSSEKVAESTGADANQAAAISAVTNSAETGNAAFDNVANNISEMLQSGDDAQVQAALDTVTAMSPEEAPMVQSVTVEGVAQVFSAIATRMSGGAVASANQGMASGDSFFEKGAAWVQTLVNHAKLSKTAANDGFKSDTAGLALGFEKMLNDDFKMGVGYAYNDSDVKSNLRKTDIDTHTAFVYGEYKPSNWFVNGMLSHNWSKYNEKTNVATSKYDVESTAMQAMVGYNMLMGKTTVTPEAGLRYVRLHQDAYTNSLGITTGGDKSDILTGVIGATVVQNWNLSNGMTLKPQARLAFTYDIKNDKANSFVTLPNGSSYTVAGKALDRFGVEAGLGVTAEINDKWELSVGYEGKFRDDYRDHTGLLNLKYKF